jgi:hypothetical protein
VLVLLYFSRRAAATNISTLILDDEDSIDDIVDFMSGNASD